MNIYRCGWCGQYTDSVGNPIDISDNNHINLKEELTHGECCKNIIQQELELDNQYQLYLNGEL